MSHSSTSLWRYMWTYRRGASLGLATVGIYLTASLVNPIILRHAIDALQQGRGARVFFTQLAIFLALALLSFGAAVIMRWKLLGLANRVEHDIRRDVFAHLTTLDAAFYQKERTGDLMTKMTSDLGAVREMIGQGLLQGTRIAIGFPLAFSIMFAADMQLALIVAALLPAVSIIFFFLIRLIRKYYDLSQEQFSEIANFAQETFAGIRTIKGFGIESRRRNQFTALNTEYIRRNMTLTRIEEPVWPLMMLLYWFGAVLLLWFAGRQIIAGTTTLGMYVQFQQHMMFLQWPMLALGWTINILQRGKTSWARIQTILQSQPRIHDAAEIRPTEHLRGDIEFSGVTLELEGRTILDQIDLKIPAGQWIGITGPTGSGKTMLISLLVRLLDPTAGAVRIGGRDVRLISLAELRRHIGLAPQEPFLFSDTLANNLAFGLEPTRDPMTTYESNILRAAEIARLSDEVQQFPQRYRTLLGERGVTLSGGQRQRTAIGRALARDPDLLILDDVLSAVDTQTEARILEQLLPVLKGRTSLLISHRVSTLRHADRIVVLDHGRIVQDGSHEELVAQPGYYQNLDEIQRLEARLEATHAPSEHGSDHGPS
ncbi:MAG: ABC transporter ATP-binding protein [Verrucomicrobia bacterium]|nr:ABC transporter ATP-binding protein/permease [Kiritimatiellia bacterium]MCO6399601.1 ABC transporter ATP-binding protein [Verrucomicrobiota bacterium]